MIKNMNPSKRQCEIARVMTKSEASDAVIKSELKKLTDAEWNEQCTILDRILKKHDAPFDKGFHTLCIDFINIDAANGVNEATVFVAYMNWLNQ